MNSNHRYRFSTVRRQRRVIICDAETSCPHGPELHSGLALLSRRSREAFSSCGMSNTATDSAAEGNPLWHRLLQRQTYSASQMRSGVGVSISQKLNMMLSSGSLETGTGSSNSLRSATQSRRFRILWRDQRICAVCVGFTLSVRFSWLVARTPSSWFVSQGMRERFEGEVRCRKEIERKSCHSGFGRKESHLQRFRLTYAAIRRRWKRT